MTAIPVDAPTVRLDDPAADQLPVAEIIGRTLQGEGPAAGRPASFLRLMGCNLSCTWCDTFWTWDGARSNLRADTTWTTADDIVDRLLDLGSGIVVVTGGEPLLHQDRPAWGHVLRRVSEQRPVHIETNGTIAPNDWTVGGADVIVVSPKLRNAGEHRGHQKPTLHDAWRDLAGQDGIHLKVVCRDHLDVVEAVDLAQRHGWDPERVWVMPEGATRDQLDRHWPAVAESAAQHGVNATHRLHVLAWGDERGR